MTQEAISFPPQDVDGDQYYDDLKLARAILWTAQPYFTEWMSLAHLAVSAFTNAAEQHIRELDIDGDADAEWAEVVSAFASAVTRYIPVVNQGMAMMGQASDVASRLMRALGHSGLNEGGAKARLQAAVTRLADEAIEAITSARESVEVPPGDGVSSPAIEMIREQLVWVEWGSMDNDYVRALVEWLFVYPTVENTYEPIRQAMEHEFAGLYFRVKAELYRDSPRHPGTSGIRPADWERSAEHEQAKDFAEHGRDGWDDIYGNE